MQERHYRTALLVLGHGVFITLAVLALEHGVMRSSYGDSAYQVHKWIAFDEWNIEAHRYTAIVPQAVVKAMLPSAPSMKALLIAASLAHALVAYAIYAWCAHVWKARVSALGCALAAVLCTRFTFYSPVLEANYLLCYPFLFLGFVERRAQVSGWPWWSWLVGCILLLPTCNVHPLGCVVLLFMVAWAWASGWMRWGQAIFFGACAAVWPAVAARLFPPTLYEQGIYDSLDAGLSSVVPFFQLPSWHYIEVHSGPGSPTYLPAVLVWLFAMAGWAARRSWWRLLLALAGPACYIALIVITFHMGQSAIMMDRAVLPLGALLAVVAAPLLPEVGTRHLRTAVITATILVCFIKLRDISFTSRHYRKQMAAQAELIREARALGWSHAIVRRDGAELEGVEVSWAFSSEVVLRSAALDGGPSVALVCDSEMPPQEALDMGAIQVLDTRFAPMPMSARYFPPDAPYHRLR